MFKKKYKQTKEHKEKISRALKGRKLSEEHKRKVGLANSISLKGKHCSPKTEFKKGCIPWIKGKKGIFKSNSGSFQKGMIPWNKGKKLSQKTKKRMSESKKGQVPWDKNKPRYDIRGKKHWNWQNGISKITNQIRQCFQYRQWRSDVFTRDDFTCQECFIRGSKLNAHHIKEFSKILEEYNIKTLEEALDCEELWNINNGQTLCSKCH